MPIEITADELIEALKGIGRRTTVRGLRLWRSNGLLPALTRKGKGQGNGTREYWIDASILDRAATVADLMGRPGGRFFALLTLGFAGFEIPPRPVREAWLFRIGAWRRHLLRRPSKSLGTTAASGPQLGDIEDLYAHHTRWVGSLCAEQLSISQDHAQTLALGLLGLLLDPEYDYVSLSIDDTEPLRIVEPIFQKFLGFSQEKAKEYLSDESRFAATIQWVKVARSGWPARHGIRRFYGKSARSCGEAIKEMGRLALARGAS